MQNTEFENNSAPNELPSFLSSLDLESFDNVSLDFDNTISATKLYYILEYIRLAKELIIPRLFPEGLTEEQEEDFVNGYVKSAFDAYKRANRPLEIAEQCSEGLRRYLEDLGYEGEDNFVEEVFDNILPFFNDFYKKAPEIYENQLVILKFFKDNGKRIGIHSHAQREWTEIKVQYLKDKFFEKYGEEIEILITTTDIEDKKDSESWKRSGEKMNFDPKRTLVIGDNWNDDIKASIQAGYYKQVWIHHYKGNL